MSAASTPLAGNIAGYSPQDVEQFGNDGDAILLVGPDQRKIQVSWSFLEHISPVFRAMFNSSMSEGEAFRNKVDENPLMVILPDDDPKTMMQMLRCLYGADPCSELSAEELKQIAILADKYDLTERLRYFGVYWLRTPDNTSAPSFLKDAWDLLVTAYILKADLAFFNISRAIINSEGSLLNYAKSSPEGIGFPLGMAIEEVRGAVRIVSLSKEMGVCMHCYIYSENSFTKRHGRCTFPYRHLSIYR